MLAKFGCNPAYYAVGKPNGEKYQYFKVDEPLTPEVLQRHLEGKETIGIYPLVEGRCQWFCIDVDDKSGLPEEQAVEAVWAAAQQQREAFEAQGLNIMLERSRSGMGVHVWGFLEEWVDAVEVRRAILPHVIDSPLIDRGKIYPSDPTKSQLGVLICLPYGGRWAPEERSVFVDPTTFEALTLEQVLAAPTNNPSIIRHMARNAPQALTSQSDREGRYVGQEVTPASGRPQPLLDGGILKLVSPQGCSAMHYIASHMGTRDARGEPVIKEPEFYALLGQLTCFERGKDAAHLIAQAHPYYRPGSSWLDEKFAHAQQNPPMGCQAIREKFPHLACKGCSKAPYYAAKRSLVDMAEHSVGALTKASFADDLARIERRTSGKRAPGVKPGIAALDPFVLLRPNEITFIGARPSMGKTALMVHMAVNIARHGTPVFVFSAETTQEPLHDRFIAHASLVDSRALRGERDRPLSADEWERVQWGLDKLRELPLYENYGATDPEDVLRLIEQSMLTHRTPLGQPFVVFYDFLQYGLSAKGEEMFPTISARTFAWKYLQKVLAQHVVVFSQVTRESEGKDSPTLSWFRGSGEIEILADSAWILTGQRVAGKEAPRTISVVKQKEGQLGEAQVVLKQDVCRVESQAEVPTEPVVPMPLAGWEP